jgi:hypothetical protein
MKRLLITFSLVLAPALAFASDHEEVHIALQSPEMAVVQPGVQVVVGQEDEVFYTNHHYWLHRDAGWYHARHHSDPFVFVESHHVPSALVTFPLGHYRHYHAHHAYAGDDGYNDGYGQHGSGGCGGGGHGH